MGLLALAALCVVYGAPALRAQDAAAAGLPERIQALLAKHKLDGDRSALVLYSTVQRRPVLELNGAQPMVVASNVKLATSYAALKLLTPHYRWRTPFYTVEDHLGVDGGTRQGLLVQGTADPSITREDLDLAALYIKSQGLWTLDGPLYLENALTGSVAHLSENPRKSGYSAWSAPVGPFIVDHNTVDLLIAPNVGGVGYELFSRDDFMTAVSALLPGENGGSAVQVRQEWSEAGAQMQLTGIFPRRNRPIMFRVAAGDGRLYFYHRLRQALAKASIAGEMPLGVELPKAALLRRVYTHISPPLGELLSEANKHSNNLVADAVLIAMAPTEGEPVTDPVQAGLDEVRRILARDFPEAGKEVELVDGSGLSRQNRMSANFLVALLNRVLHRETFRSEYLASLSVLGHDGTMQFRDVPPRLWGQLRGKTGTLAGTQALSGYLYTDKDMYVFSFLINDPERNTLELQEAQNQVITGIFDLLVPPGSSNRVPLPPLPKRLRPPLPSPPKAPQPAQEKL